MKYQSVAILGAGAVGSYVMWGLAKKKEIDLCVVASGARKVRYERDGFVINGQEYLPAAGQQIAYEPADLFRHRCSVHFLFFLGAACAFGAGAAGSGNVAGRASIPVRKAPARF